MYNTDGLQLKAVLQVFRHNDGKQPREINARHSKQPGHLPGHQKTSLVMIRDHNTSKAAKRLVK